MGIPKNEAVVAQRLGSAFSTSLFWELIVSECLQGRVCVGKDVLLFKRHKDIKLPEILSVEQSLRS